MSILYEGNYRIIDLSRWHLWRPWIPIRLTDGGYSRRGKWYWIRMVERRTVRTKIGKWVPIWEFREVG